MSLITESPNVKVDDDGLKVKPNHTRCTVILREIPDDTEKHEVEVSSSAAAVGVLKNIIYLHAKFVSAGNIQPSTMSKDTKLRVCSERDLVHHFRD